MYDQKEAIKVMESNIYSLLALARDVISDHKSKKNAVAQSDRILDPSLIDSISEAPAFSSSIRGSAKRLKVKRGKFLAHALAAVALTIILISSIVNANIFLFTSSASLIIVAIIFATKEKREAIGLNDDIIESASLEEPVFRIGKFIIEEIMTEIERVENSISDKTEQEEKAIKQIKSVVSSFRDGVSEKEERELSIEARHAMKIISRRRL